MDASGFVVLDFGLIEPHCHTAGRLIPEFRCMVILVVNRHGAMNVEYDKPSFGVWVSAVWDEN